MFTQKSIEKTVIPVKTQLLIHFAGEGFGYSKDTMNK